MATYRVQMRYYQGMSQWKSDRYGWQSRVSYSAWKTICSCVDLETAKKHCANQSQAGLKEYRVMFKGQQVFSVC